MVALLIQIIFSYLSAVSFGVITNVPRRALWACGFTGMIGWMIFYFINNSRHGLGVANFLAAFVIGVLSIFFSRRLKMPMIIFIIPGIVPLVPGGAAYQAVRNLFLNQHRYAFENIMIVIVTAGAIAGAFMMTSMIETIIKQRNQKRTNSKQQK
ncbi:MAG: threonine/serine exporter family protein [Enterococcus sp.]